MIQNINKPSDQDTDDDLVLNRQSKVNIHSVMLVILSALVITFLMVVGLSYLYDAKHLEGQSSKYFCPSFLTPQVGICVKS